MRRTPLHFLLQTVALAAAIATYPSIAAPRADASPQPRVFGGTAVAPAKFASRWPYLVGVFVDGGAAGSCGGALVGRATVVTAAHCVLQGDRLTGAPYPPARFVVTSGHPLLPKAFKLAVHRVVVNPNWTPTSLTGDIAVLQLAEPAIAAGTISPLTAADAAPVGAGAFAAGWGATGASSSSTQLLETPLQVGDETYCASQAGISSLYNSAEHLCAGDTNGNDTCEGDSGGPLTWVDGAGTTRLAGVVSFGVADGCSAATSFAIYTRVANYDGWIAANRSPFEQNPTTPQSVRLGSVGPGAVKVTWSASTGAARIASYDVLRKSGSSWRRLTRTSRRSFVVRNIQNGSYRFAVTARDARGRTSLRGLAPVLNVSF